MGKLLQMVDGSCGNWETFLHIMAKMEWGSDEYVVTETYIRIITGEKPIEYLDTSRVVIMAAAILPFLEDSEYFLR